MIRPIVLSGPSGSGKSTILKELMNRHKNAFGFSISHTTRDPRPGEVNGKDYHFIKKADMQDLIKQNQFLEHAEFAGNIYGTSFKSVEDVQKSKKICILDIDMNGVKSVKKTSLKPVYIFIKPPSREILEKRLRDRGTETEDKIKMRLDKAQSEMDYANEKGVYDFILVNDDLKKAVNELETFIKPELDALKK